MINQDRLVKTFINLVKIDSESGNEKQISDYCVSLAKEIGFKAWNDSYYNVYIEAPGSGDSLMINTHLDTVSPGKNVKPIIEKDYIKSDGTTILGADSKSGIAACFELLYLFKKQNLSHKNLLFTLSCNEEVGIPTAKYIKSDIKECIVPDRGTPLGEVITEAPFAQVFMVDIVGKAAYATTSFNKGRHAILAAAEMITKLPVGNFDQYSTSNIGIVNGGSMTTLVPEKAFFKGNCYSFQKRSVNFFMNQLNEIVKKTDNKYGTKSKITILETFSGYKINRNDPLVNLAYSSIKKAGLSPKFKVYKAATNANILNEIGIKSIVISTGVENQHTIQEKIAIKTLFDTTNILLHAVT